MYYASVNDSRGVYMRVSTCPSSNPRIKVFLATFALRVSSSDSQYLGLNLKGTLVNQETALKNLKGSSNAERREQRRIFEVYD